jgi:hypothetical protein
MKKKRRPVLCSIRFDHSCIFCASKENDDLPRQARGKRQKSSTVQNKRALYSITQWQGYDSGAKNASFGAIFIYTTIIMLPRQARDRQRES